jgi:GntR family transcriptional regulator, transcriptional repressor for pyruvate dehydrogenase complex
MARFAEPIPSIRTPETAIEHILEAIERVGLRVGDRLPPESELAVQLGISSPTLRKALRVLEGAGLLQIRGGNGGGIFIASELLPLETISSGKELETAEIVQTLRGRRVLETAVTELAATSALREDMEGLERTLTLLRRHLDDPVAVRRADLMFHAAVARATHNRLLHDAMRLLARDMVPLRDAYSPHVDPDVILDIHRRQLREMRHLEFTRLREVLDEHFRLLEEPFARSLGRSWEDVFVRPPVRATSDFEPPWSKLSRLVSGFRGYKPHSQGERGLEHVGRTHDEESGST